MPFNNCKCCGRLFHFLEPTLPPDARVSLDPDADSFCTDCRAERIGDEQDPNERSVESEPDIETRLSAAQAAAEPYPALYCIAESLRDSGTTQPELYRLFKNWQLRHEKDESEMFHDAISEVMDNIWHGNDLFTTSLTNKDVKQGKRAPE
ncbi:MAG: hypothetical protein AAF483_09100 [Planctomycetota bacterium]